MKEHMEVPLDTSNMSEQELQFHYFKVPYVTQSNYQQHVRTGASVPLLQGMSYSLTTSNMSE